MKINRLRVFFLFVVLCIMVSTIIGCGVFSGIKKTTGRIARDITGSNSGLKKKVAFGWIQDATSFSGTDLGAYFGTRLADNVGRACPDMLLAGAGESEGLKEFFAKNPGRPEPVLLADAGRAMGLNAVLSARILEIGTFIKPAGLLWFKGNETWLRMIFNVEVYDTETGAKLLAENLIHEMELEGEEPQHIDEKKAQGLSFLKSAMDEPLSDLAEKICDALHAEPWKSYVTSVSGDAVVLSAGKNSGLIPGDSLVVYQSRRVIAGVEGRYYLPGVKIGEIRITSVHANRSEALRVSGEAGAVGDMVKKR